MKRRKALALTPAALLLLVVSAGCATTSDSAVEGTKSKTPNVGSTPKERPPLPSPSFPGNVVIAAAGDIACAPPEAGASADDIAKFNNGDGAGAGRDGTCRQKWTAKYVKDHLNEYAAVLPLGDMQYQTMSESEMEVYKSTWGQQDIWDKSLPVRGNHDTGVYQQYWNGTDPANGKPNAVGKAGIVKENWYSFDTGDGDNGWHVVVLNAQCGMDKADGKCGDFGGGGPAQLKWLANELKTTKKKCTMATFHQPLWYPEDFQKDSKVKGKLEDPSVVKGPGLAKTLGTDPQLGSTPADWNNEPEMKAYWDVLSQSGADVVLNGHHHFYGRMKPLDINGMPVAEGQGIREFISGAGGASMYGMKLNTERADAGFNDTYGILELGLNESGYNWDFKRADFAENGNGKDSGGVSDTACRAKTPGEINLSAYTK